MDGDRIPHRDSHFKPFRAAGAVLQKTGTLQLAEACGFLRLNRSEQFLRGLFLPGGLFPFEPAAEISAMK